MTFPAYQFKFPRGQTLRLSIQGSPFHYCDPREDFAFITDYKLVEIGILLDGEFLKPSEAGLEGFDELFTDEEVAGYCPILQAMAMLAGFTTLYGRPTIDENETRELN